MRLVNLVGFQFSHLRVLSRAHDSSTRSSHPMWLCICQCGRTRIVEGGNLRAGRSRSCGLCGVTRSKSESHKRSHPLYRTWAGMLTRCRNHNEPGWERYGGRGISVCERWLSFDVFAADVGPKPSPAHSLDRINNDGNYEPGNVRWATPTEQANNRRRRRWKKRPVAA